MYNTILLPLDGSKLSECAIEHLRAIASGCQASQVLLLSVVGQYEPGSGFRWGGIISESQMAQAAREAEKTAQKYLAGVQKKLEKDGLTVSTEVLVGTPADSILDYAKANAVDLIIMATHGRSGISRWAMGSIAERVLIAAPMPVLLVSPKGCRV